MDLSNYIIAFNEECKQEDNYCKVKNYIENLLALDEKFIMVQLRDIWENMREKRVFIKFTKGIWSKQEVGLL